MLLLAASCRGKLSHPLLRTHTHPSGPRLTTQTLRLCLRLRIPVVSVYAFAIDNFNRPPEEVDAIMTLARDSLREICQEE